VALGEHRYDIDVTSAPGDPHVDRPGNTYHNDLPAFDASPSSPVSPETTEDTNRLFFDFLREFEATHGRLPIYPSQPQHTSTAAPATTSAYPFQTETDDAPPVDVPMPDVALGEHRYDIDVTSAPGDPHVDRPGNTYHNDLPTFPASPSSPVSPETTEDTNRLFFDWLDDYEQTYGPLPISPSHPQPELPRVLVRVPGNGWCLLSSVILSAPTQVAALLRSPDSTVDNDPRDGIVAEWLNELAQYPPAAAEEVSRSPHFVNATTVVANRLARIVRNPTTFGFDPQFLQPLIEAHLAGVVTNDADSLARVSGDERTAFADAVQNWATSWRSDAGDAFVSLLAETLDARVHVHDVAGGSYCLDPDGLVRSVEVHLLYTNNDHWDALLPAAPPATPMPPNHHGTVDMVTPAVISDNAADNGPATHESMLVQTEGISLRIDGNRRGTLTFRDTDTTIRLKRRQTALMEEAINAYAQEREGYAVADFRKALQRFFPNTPYTKPEVIKCVRELQDLFNGSKGNPYELLESRIAVGSGTEICWLLRARSSRRNLGRAPARTGRPGDTA
ncbi:hypothetical protein ACIBTV_13255, partial [Micromonospora sp. NPDC049366]|uniref:hypothetical protein n=1 Tax=Micromonospora sp. NPDC049366 TaxID=3364271 RepID=UPI00379F833E